jgi:tetratricopeptide (TPR) repeat protein
MWTIIIALATGALVGAGLRVSGAIHSTAAAILPGVLATLVAGIFLFRRVAGRITPLVEEAQRHLQGGRRELALSTLRDGLRWGRWHPLLVPQLRTQIGALLYAQQDYAGALVELKQASKRPWESRAYLACTYFKTRDEAGMVKALEDVVKIGEKDDLPWTLYAWCLNAVGKKDEAQAVLRRGLEKLPANQRLQNSLEAVQAGKKIKVEQYGDRWNQFGLDGGGVVTGGKDVPKWMRGFAQRPGFRQKPQRKR